MMDGKESCVWIWTLLGLPFPRISAELRPELCRYPLEVNVSDILACSVYGTSRLRLTYLQDGMRYHVIFRVTDTAPERVINAIIPPNTV